MRRLGLCLACCLVLNACSEAELTCADNARKCTDDHQGILRCVGGAWEWAEMCYNDTVCDGNKFICVQNPELCVDGARRCSNDLRRVEVCVGSSWAQERECTGTEYCDSTQLACITPSSAPSCAPGSFQCVNNVIMRCEGMGWSQFQTCASPLRCDAVSGTCVRDQECTSGTKKCDADLSRTLVCADGFWTLGQACDGGQCDPATIECTVGCAEGDKKCSPGKDSVLKCSGNQWISEQTCGASAYCNDLKAACVDLPVCVENSASCDLSGGSVKECVDGKWKTTPCASGRTCVNGKCIATLTNVCTLGVTECKDNNIVRCVGGIPETSSCGDQVCMVRSGKAVCESHVCNEGDAGCVSATKKKTCEQNEWRETSCGSGYQCDAGNGECVLTVCSEGAMRCSNNAAEKCVNNAWQAVKACGSDNCELKGGVASCQRVSSCQTGAKKCNGNVVETCSGNKYTQSQVCDSATQICSASGTNASCVARVCAEGAYKCEGSALKFCKDNVWVTSQTCSGDKPLCDASKTACVARVCAEGALKCSGTGKSLMVCKGNAWKTQSECYKSDSTCVVRDGKAACEAKMCANGVTCTDNTLRVCSGNAYIVEQPCLSSETCSVESASCEANPECAAGEYKCEGSTLYMCSPARQWQVKNTCVSPEICDASSKKCVDTSVCSNGSYYCDGQVLKKCSGGQWATEKTCDVTYSCNADKKTCVLKPVCTDGEYSCNGKTLRTCQGGQWVDSKTCSASQTCSASLKKCVECDENDFQCSGMTLQKCVSGAWTAQKTCASGQTCNASLEKCVECSGDIWQCSGQKLQSCADDLWKTEKTCDNASYCDASQKKCIKKDVCTNGEYACVNNSLNICSNGQWQEKQACTAKENCDANAKKCVLKPVCTKGETVCDGNSLKTCDASGQWAVNDCGMDALCVTANASAQCVAKMTLPAWCNTQHVRDDRDQGYGRVLLPDGVKPEDISARFVCGDVQQPVSSWTYGVSAVYNKDCDDCGNNIEFMSYSLSAPAGTYRCAFTFDFGPQTIACPANNDGNDAIPPIVLSDSTKLTSAQTKEITVLASSNEAPTWCYFKHFDEPSQNDFQGTWQAYGRILPPGLATPAQITARLICGAADAPAANWTVMRDAEQNLFCPADGYDACGANNLEYMSSALIDKAHALEPGSYSCAFRFDVGGKSYVCSTYRDGANTGGQPVLLVPGKVLTSAESWGITVQ